MKNRAGTAPVWLLATLLLCCLAVVTEAQNEPGAGTFKITGIRQRTRQAPDYGGSNTSLGGKTSAANRPWYHIEVEFSSEPEWADDVLVKYYVLVGTGREARLFSGSVNHVDVSKGSKHYSAMFLHPNTLERYGRGKVEAVGIQLFHLGRLVDEASEPSARQRWWERLTPISGFLLAPEQTPWSVVAFERYETSRPAPVR